MKVKTAIALLSLAGGLAGTAMADTYPVIVKGRVLMEDGTPPPFTVSVERSCTDSKSGTPGPLVNKKNGEWTWRIEINAFDQRACSFRAVHPGYSSTAVDGSRINMTSHDVTATVPDIILMAAVPDPASIRLSDETTPGKAKSFMAQATKSMDARDYRGTQAAIKLAVAAVPKYAQGWHALGIVDQVLQQPEEAKDAFNHAVEADPKDVASWVMLSRACLKLKDWDCALKAADNELKLDTKHVYTEIYLHRAVAQYGLKDMDGAEKSVAEAIKADTAHKRPRSEYVEGRILEAKGDINGARDHMTKYVQLAPAAPDLDAVKAHIELLGKNTGAEPDLEPL